MARNKGRTVTATLIASLDSSVWNLAVLDELARPLYLEIRAWVSQFVIHLFPFPDRARKSKHHCLPFTRCLFRDKEGADLVLCHVLAGEDCRTSSDCNISKGLCCKLHRRARSQPKKVSSESSSKSG